MAPRRPRPQAVVEVLVRHELTYEITDDLMRAATRRFVLHHAGWRVWIALGLLTLLLIPICAPEDDHFICGIFIGAVILLAVLVAVAYATRDRRAVQTARKLSTREARCVLTDDAIELENALARSAIKWPLVQKVVRGTDVWLLFMSRQQYFALPADKLAGEAGEFLAARVKAAGGKVT
jgi:hypothetical protein